MLVTPHEGVGFPRFVLGEGIFVPRPDLLLWTWSVEVWSPYLWVMPPLVAIVVLTDTGGQKNFSIGVWNGREGAVGAALSG